MEHIPAGDPPGPADDHVDRALHPPGRAVGGDQRRERPNELLPEHPVGRRRRAGVRRPGRPRPRSRLRPDRAADRPDHRAGQLRAAAPARHREHPNGRRDQPGAPLLPGDRARAAAALHPVGPRRCAGRPDQPRLDPRRHPALGPVRHQRRARGDHRRDPERGDRRPRRLDRRRRDVAVCGRRDRRRGDRARRARSLPRAQLAGRDPNLRRALHPGSGFAESHAPTDAETVKRADPPPA